MLLPHYSVSLFEGGYVLANLVDFSSDVGAEDLFGHAISYYFSWEKRYTNKGILFGKR